MSREGATTEAESGGRAGWIPGGAPASLAVRLRPLRAVCAALAAGVAVCAALVAVLVHRGWTGEPPRAPFNAPSLALTFFAMILILLASRLRGVILGPARTPAATAGAVLGAYARATLVSFGLLAAVGAAGLAVALLSGSALYGLVLCAAGLLGMLARWPRAAEVERLARGRFPQP